jgi:aldose 1-epimerase
MSSPPSGEQLEISYRDQRATVVEVGGGVREYRVGDRPVLDPYPVDGMCDGAHGAPLIPWPNRLADGRYRFDGEDHQLPLSEPDKGNAIHGLLRWRSWHALERAADRVVVGTTLHPCPGYPFALDVRIDYALGDGGLRVETTVRNVGDRALPYACGQHPYLSPGSGRIDDCLLELDARTRILTDAERQLPTGTEAVEGGPFDFRTRVRLGDRQLDAAFTDLERDDGGRAWVRLTAPDGHRVDLWMDETYRIVQLYTGDTLSKERRRRGLAAEPMTSPPNAFRTGDSLIQLEPGASVTSAWGIALS